MVKLWLDCRKSHIQHSFFVFFSGWHAPRPPPPPPRMPGTTSAHPGALILRARSKPTDFLNQRVGKYVLRSPAFNFGPPVIHVQVTHVHVFLNSRFFLEMKPIFRLCTSLGSIQPSPPKLDFRAKSRSSSFSSSKYWSNFNSEDGGQACVRIKNFIFLLFHFKREIQYNKKDHQYYSHSVWQK